VRRSFLGVASLVAVSIFGVAGCGSGDEVIVETQINESAEDNSDLTLATDSEPVDGDDSIRHDDSEPVDGDDSIRHDDSEPVDGDDSVRHDDSEPVDGDDSIRHDDSEPKTEPRPTTSVKETFPIVAGVNTYYFDQEIEGRVVQRPWILHVPTTFNDNSPRPLLFAFHGNGGNAQSWVRAMDRWTNELNVIGVYLQGHLESWNLGAERSKANDIEFVQKVFETLAPNPIIDTDRVVALGTSNGGGMVLQLAGRTEIFSAVAAVVTHLAYGWEPNTQNRPVSILQISAQGDPLIPYGGGQSPVGHRFYPAEESAQIWASYNQCASSATQRTTDEGSTVLTWNRCRDNTRVHHWGVDIPEHHIPENTEGGLHQLIFEFFDLG